jgi:hypothetical protein
VKARLRIHDTPRDQVRETMVRRFVDVEAVEIAEAWAQAGWTQPLIARATRCATSLIAVFGPGDYRIIAVDRWVDRGGPPQSGSGSSSISRGTLGRDAAGRRGHRALNSAAPTKVKTSLRPPVQ